MIPMRFTAADILAPDENEEPANPFEAQLLASYRQCMTDIIATEGKPRALTRKEYSHIAQFLSGHQGNPIGFALAVALRKSEEGIPFLTSIRGERLVIGAFHEEAGAFQGRTWSPLEDPALRATYHEHRSSRYWLLYLPRDYPHTLALEQAEGEHLGVHVMYSPGPVGMLPGVFLPYDATYPLLESHLLPQRRLDTHGYVVQKLRLHQPDGYLLSLGTFAQFAVEAFPVLCPDYRIPERGQPGAEHLLELFLRACYGKRFRVNATSFLAEDDHGISGHGMPDWAQRWMLLWNDLPPGSPIGKEEVLALLDLLWNVPMDARSILDAALDNWLYRAIWGPREKRS